DPPPYGSCLQVGEGKCPGELLCSRYVVCKLGPNVTDPPVLVCDLGQWQQSRGGGDIMKTSWKGLLAAFLTAGLGAAPTTRAQCVVPPLAQVGPIDPVNGFPQFYRDGTGLTLAPCLDFVCDPALALPDPAAPVVFPTNFPDEFFYHRVIARLTSGTLRA